MYEQLCTGTMCRYPTQWNSSLLLSYFSPFLVYSIRSPSSFTSPTVPLLLTCFLLPTQSCQYIDLLLALLVLSFLSTGRARCPRSTTCCDVQRTLDDTLGQSRDSAHAACATIFVYMMYCIIIFIYCHLHKKNSFVWFDINQQNRIDINPRKPCRLSRTPTTISLPNSHADVRRNEREWKRPRIEREEEYYRDILLLLRSCTFSWEVRL